MKLNFVEQFEHARKKNKKRLKNDTIDISLHNVIPYDCRLKFPDYICTFY